MVQDTLPFKKVCYLCKQNCNTCDYQRGLLRCKDIVKESQQAFRNVSKLQTEEFTKVRGHLLTPSEAWARVVYDNFVRVRST